MPSVSPSRKTQYTTTHRYRIAPIQKTNDRGSNQGCFTIILSIVAQLKKIYYQLSHKEAPELKVFYHQTPQGTEITISLEGRSKKDTYCPLFIGWAKLNDNETKWLYYDLILELGSLIGIGKAQMKAIFEDFVPQSELILRYPFKIRDQIPDLFQKLQNLSMSQWSQIFQLLLVDGPPNFTDLHQKLLSLKHLPQKMDQIREFYNLRRNQENAYCSIRLEGGSDSLLFPCKHFFHKQEIIEWIKQNDTCPNCKRKIVEVAMI